MKELLALQARDVRGFLAARRSEGVGSRSLARTLSALRMFYKFLERRGYGKNDAIRAVSLPKLPHSVPKPLTAPKATALVDGADIASPGCAGMDLGARHRRARAALRLGLAHLGGTVAEAQGRADQRPRHAARARAKATRRGWCRCCRSCARRSSSISRSVRCNSGLTIRCSSAHAASSSSPRIIQLKIAGARAALGLPETATPACAAAFLRHASARRRRRPPRHPGAARPRQPVDHARLYRGRPRSICSRPMTSAHPRA